MGMSMGCTEASDKFFAKKWNCVITQLGTHIIIHKDNQSITLTGMYGDCTAATLYSTNCTNTKFPTFLKLVLKYLSINGRITCLFTRKLLEHEVTPMIKKLKKLPIIGLHVQQSNRTGPITTYQLTGILKVPNPYVKREYSYHMNDVATLTHNHLDMSELQTDNQKFNLSL